MGTSRGTDLRPGDRGVSHLSSPAQTSVQTRMYPAHLQEVGDTSSRARVLVHSMDLKETAPSRCVLRGAQGSGQGEGQDAGELGAEGQESEGLRRGGKGVISPEALGRGRGMSGRGRVERRKRKGGASRLPPKPSIQPSRTRKLRLQGDKLFKYELRKGLINMDIISMTRNKIHTIGNQNKMTFSH